MWQQKSGKLVLFGFLMLLTSICHSQEAIKNVQIEKVSATQYRIRYQLNQSDDFEFAVVKAKIYRKRAGKVEEVFSDEITPFNFNANGQAFIYNWITEPGTVKDGDELQARIILSFSRTPQVKPRAGTKKNIPPIANAGNFMEIQLPGTTPVVLDGSKSSDSDGKIIEYKWKQIGGPSTLILTSKNSQAIISGPIREGSYAFELSVKDQMGATAKDRIIMVVKPAPALISTPAVTNVEVPKKDSIEVLPVVPAQSRGKMKGGPSNVLLNLAVPGLGHYFVSGDHYGKGRKPVVFVITALYAGAVGGGLYFLSKSESDYDKYTELAGYREYQRDDNGNIIGIRGGNEQQAKAYLNSGKSAQTNAKILLGAGAGILVTDFVLTLIKGNRNKTNWKNEAAGRTGFIISSNGSQVTAGIRIKL